MSSAGQHSNEFRDNAAESQYEVIVDGEVGGIIQYRLADGVVDLQHTIVLPTHRGQGLAFLTTEYAVDRIVADGRTIVPVCWVAERWFAAHPERADALAPSA